MWLGSGRYTVVVTVTGAARNALVTGLALPAGMLAVSFRPIWRDADSRAGCSTPVARPTPSVPARWLVRMVISGRLYPGPLAFSPANSSSDAGKPAGITTAA